MSEDDQKNKKKFTAAIGFGTEFAAGVILLTFIGYKVDEKYETGETFTLVGVFLGIFYGFYQVWKLIRILNNNNNDENSD